MTCYSGNVFCEKCKHTAEILNRWNTNTNMLTCREAWGDKTNYMLPVCIHTFTFKITPEVTKKEKLVTVLCIQILIAKITQRTNVKIFTK